jgi:signal transduction histidine kinase
VITLSAEKPELDEGPFMKEERRLIDTVAGEIGLLVERKLLEKERLRLQDQLMHADRLATIGQLAAGVAHELNEPLESVLGFAQLLRKSGDLSDQTTRDADRIIKAALHAREVVRKLVSFARQQTAEKVETNLNTIVGDGLYFLESRCAKAGITLSRELAATLPPITADPVQLHQALVNIVVNAIQAMPLGGTLTVRTYGGDHDVCLSVEDTGVGMSEDVLKNIFTPFFTTKSAGQGTGLGLSVVHGIVSAHGGSIRVESKPGQGSLFEIQLPLSVNRTEHITTGSHESAD